MRQSILAWAAILMPAVGLIAALPPSEKIALAGLRQPVEHNVARDRLFQLELCRRQTTGTMAEITGCKELKRDTFFRRGRPGTWETCERGAGSSGISIGKMAN